MAYLALSFSKEQGPAPLPVKDNDCDIEWVRIPGYSNIKPLLITEHRCESPRYEPIKRNVAAFIEQEKRKGNVSDVGFYLRDFQQAEWTMYHGDMPFEPGSLMKIPLLMTYLRMAEKDPTVMSRQYSLQPGAQPEKWVRFPSARRMEEGRSYTVAQLLALAVEHSDNMAVMVLLRHMDSSQFHRTFTDVGLMDFNDSDPSYRISPKGISIFMKAIYNSTYLSLDDSELAISMMLKCDFNVGLEAGLPPDVRIAHKFGESHDGRDWQLHETALIYKGNDPYLLTVMTKGPRMETLPGVLAGISRIVFEQMPGQQGSVTR